MNTLAAITVAQKYPVFPCRPKPEGERTAKSPRTKNGFKDASQLESQVLQWWAQWPDSLVGVPTGHTSGLVVIDDDTAKKSDALSAAWLERNRAHLASTRQQMTVSGSRHFIFSLPAGVDIKSASGITVDGQKLAAIDTRGNGGYIIDWSAHGFASLGEIKPLPADLIAQLTQDAAPATPPPPATMPDEGEDWVWKSHSLELPAALVFLNPADRDEWYQTGMAIHHASGGKSAGFKIWHKWSAGEFTPNVELVNGKGAANYQGETDCLKTWKSFGKKSAGAPKTIKSIFAIARERGYVPAGTMVPVPPSPASAANAVAVEQVVLAGEFTRTKSGLIHGTMRNAVVYLTGIPWMQEVFFDEFSQRIFYQGKEWSPRNETPQLLAIQTLIPAMSPDSFARAVEAVALSNRRDRLRDWIEALPRWSRADGRRLTRWLSSAFGCPPDRYHMRVGRNWLISMIARGLVPGCKVDTMPVLEGLQGKRKSTALHELAQPFFIEAAGVNFGNKDFLMALQGAWLIEMPELSALRMADVESIKATLTTRTDRYRAPYDRRPQDHPRRSVFAGSVNEATYLRDSTGNRRFLPIECRTVDVEWIRDNRDMLFAEALDAFRRGRKWWHFPKEATEAIQDERLPGDPWASLVAQWMVERGLTMITSDDLHTAVGVLRERRNRSTETRLGHVMRKSFPQWRKTRVTLPVIGRTYRWELANPAPFGNIPPPPARMP